MPNHDTGNEQIMDFLRENMLTKQDGAALSVRVDEVSERMSHFEIQQDSLAEKVLDMDLRMEDIPTRTEMTAMRDEILTAVDKTAKRQEIFDHELTAMRHRLDRMATT
jgi:hypothetical protein